MMPSASSHEESGREGASRARTLGGTGPAVGEGDHLAEPPPFLRPAQQDVPPTRLATTTKEHGQQAVPDLRAGGQGMPCTCVRSGASSGRGAACGSCHLLHVRPGRSRPSKSMRQRCKLMASRLAHPDTAQEEAAAIELLAAQSSYMQNLLKGVP